jgi:ferredoxin
VKATVDKSLCLGCGVCVEVCPEVFEIGDDNTAQAKTTPVPAGAEESCRDAADQCPESAIKIEDDLP